MAGDDGIAPPLTGSEPVVPLLYESPMKSSNFLAEVLAYPEANALELIHWLAIVPSAFANHLEGLPLVFPNPPLEVLGLPGRA